MAIRMKTFVTPDGEYFRAIKITEKNLTELVAHIVRHGGAATGHLARPEFKRPARIRIKQRNFGNHWGKVDWRVAKIGDWIVRTEKNEFLRVKQQEFENPDLGEKIRG